jgi:mono/diheme cytochrome c family protein
MERQPRFDAYEANPFFADGRSMRTPPPGSVPRERPLATTAAATGLADGVALDRIPVAVTKDVLSTGRRTFDVTCAACHGVLGDGQAVIARQMSLRPPPSLLTPEIRAYPPGRVFAVISEGYGMMPTYRTQISEDARWAVVAYLRALQLSQEAPLQWAPADVRARLLAEAP